MAVLVFAVFLPAAPNASAFSCSTDTSVALSTGGSPVKEVNTGTPIVVAAEYDGNCMPVVKPNAWIIEMRRSDGFIESIRWQSISPTESLPYRITTQWLPLRADNYGISAKIAFNLASYCSGIDVTHRDYKNCKEVDLSVSMPVSLGSGSAGLVVLGDLKGILRDLSIMDRFDVRAKLFEVPVNLDSVVQVTLSPLRWPTEHPSFLNFEIYDSREKLVQAKAVHDPVKNDTPMFIRSHPGAVDAFSGIDWVPAKAGKYAIKATLTDSLTEPKISTHVVKIIRVVNR